MRAHINGTNVKEIVSYGVVRPGNTLYTVLYYCPYTEGIAVDWVHNNIYWTDSYLKRIEVSNFNGRQRSILHSGLHSPKDIIVDPYNRCTLLISVCIMVYNNY